jgi:hypothetical protein
LALRKNTLKSLMACPDLNRIVCSTDGDRGKPRFPPRSRPQPARPRAVKADLTSFPVCDYIPSILSTEGALMRRHDSGAGCGARGCASQAHPREALGNRPPSLRGAAPCWAGRGRTKAAKAAGSGWRRASRPSPGSTVPRTEIAAVERRKACALAKGAPRSQERGSTIEAPTGALLPRFGEHGMGRRRARAAKNRAGGAIPSPPSS